MKQDHLKCVATLPCDLLLSLYTCFRLSLFSDINVSQGSVATLARYGEIFNANCIANFLTSQPVKNYENRPTSDEFIVKVQRCAFFETQCIYGGGNLVSLGNVISLYSLNRLFMYSGVFGIFERPF